MLSLLAPDDQDSQSQLCGQLVYIIKRLLNHSDTKVNLNSVIQTTENDEDSLISRIHKKLIETIQKMFNSNQETNSLLCCHKNLLITTLRHILNASKIDPLIIKTAKFLVDSGQDKIEIDNFTVRSFLDIFCSRFHSVESVEQLNVIMFLFREMYSEDNVRRKYLENRKNILCEQDCLNTLNGDNISDLCVILEMEMSIEKPEDRRHLLHYLLSSFSQISLLM